MADELRAALFKALCEAGMLRVTPESYQPAMDAYAAIEAQAAERAVKGSLDAAWAEAEAALPEEATLLLIRDGKDAYTAEADKPNHKEGDKWVGGFGFEFPGTTPADALKALTACLSTPTGGDTDGR